MPHVRIWVHAVWGTKSRKKFLTSEVKAQVIAHIRQNAKSKDIFIKSLNGYYEHMHCLLSLNADMTLARAMQLIKGESAYWINKNKITKQHFEWADEYFAISVSESVVPKVIRYIERQEEHHRAKSFQEEYEKLMKAYQFSGQG
jgi:putative transposase